MIQNVNSHAEEPIRSTHAVTGARSINSNFGALVRSAPNDHHANRDHHSPLRENRRQDGSNETNRPKVNRREGPKEAAGYEGREKERTGYGRGQETAQIQAR